MWLGQKDYILNVVILAIVDQVCQLSDTGPIGPLYIYTVMSLLREVFSRNIFTVGKKLPQHINK